MNLVQAVRNASNKTTVGVSRALSNLQELQAIRSVTALFNAIEAGCTLINTECACIAGLNRSSRGNRKEGGNGEDDGGELHFDCCGC